MSCDCLGDTCLGTCKKADNISSHIVALQSREIFDCIKKIEREIENHKEINEIQAEIDKISSYENGYDIGFEKGFKLGFDQGKKARW